MNNRKNLLRREIEMRIILAKTGQGKTNKIIEMMVDPTQAGESCIYITGEESMKGIMERITETDVDITKVQYLYTNDIRDVFANIENKEQPNHVFIDGIPNQSEAYLKALSQGGDVYSKEIVVTVQANAGAVEDGLIVMSYEDYIEESAK